MRRNVLRANEGGVVVEAAATLMAVLTIILGLLDISALFSVASSLEHAAGVAGDAFAVSRDADAMADRARDAIMPFAASCLETPEIRLYDSLAALDATDGEGGYGFDGTVPAQAVAARVELRCTWTHLTPVVATIMGGPTILRARTMVVFE